MHLHENDRDGLERLCRYGARGAIAHSSAAFSMGKQKETGPEVWATDITYIPMARGFVYLVAIIDWFSRFVLSWRVSNTLDTSFCVDALEGTLARWGTPGIFNTDQGAQFTASDFVDVLLRESVQVSMDHPPRYTSHRCSSCSGSERLHDDDKHLDDIRSGRPASRTHRSGEEPFPRLPHPDFEIDQEEKDARDAFGYAGISGRR